MLWRLEAVELDPTTARTLYPQQRHLAQSARRQADADLRPDRPAQFQHRARAVGRRLLPEGAAAHLCRPAHRPVDLGALADSRLGRDFWRRGADVRRRSGQRRGPGAVGASTARSSARARSSGPSAAGPRTAAACWPGSRPATTSRSACTTPGTGPEDSPPLWSKQVPLGSRGTLVDGEELAILEPGARSRSSRWPAARCGSPRRSRPSAR